MSSRFNYKKTKSSFYETQKLRYVLPYLLVALLLLALSALAFEKFVTGKSMFFVDLKVWQYIVVILLIPVPLALIVLRTRLDTVVDEDGVLYRWMPYDKRFHLLHWSAINEVVLLDLKPEGLFWRLRLKHHKRFFLGGRYSMEVRMRNGQKVLLGTHKPEELQRSLSRNAGTKFNQEASTIIFDYS
jgi:hypothetical protein